MVCLAKQQQSRIDYSFLQPATYHSSEQFHILHILHVNLLLDEYKELLAVVAEDTAEPGRKPKWKSMKRFANRELNAKNDVKYNYYAYDIDDNFFYKYIASGK